MYGGCCINYICYSVHIVVYGRRRRCRRRCRRWRCSIYEGTRACFHLILHITLCMKILINTPFAPYLNYLILRNIYKGMSSFKNLFCRISVTVRSTPLSVVLRFEFSISSSCYGASRVLWSKFAYSPPSPHQMRITSLCKDGKLTEWTN